MTTTEAIAIVIQTGIITTAIISAPIVHRKGEELDKSLRTKTLHTTAKEAEHQWQDHSTKNNAQTTMLNPKTLTTEAITTIMAGLNSKYQGASITISNNNTLRVAKDNTITSIDFLVQEVDLSIRIVIDNKIKDLTKLMLLRIDLLQSSAKSRLEVGL